jgi:hypothetical protein
VLLLGATFAIDANIDVDPGSDCGTTPKLHTPTTCPIIVHWYMNANEDGDLSNAQIYFGKRAASVDEFTYMNDDYRTGRIITYVSEGNPLCYIVQFLTPQNEESILNYFTELVAFINNSAEKQGIGRFPLCFYYEYPV